MGWGETDFVQGGDTVAAVIDILTNMTPELTVTFPTVTVSSNYRGYTSESRWVRVIQQGAFENFKHVERPRIDVEVLAERRSVALDMAQICLASVKYQAGRYLGNGVFISHCLVEQGITDITDKLSESPRFVFSVRLTCKPKDNLTPAT